MKDMKPVPFGTRHVKLAERLKDFGSPWVPHVGCFARDAQGTIEAGSPFPENIYSILSLHIFLSIFGSTDTMCEKLVWLPTWHQASLLCRRPGVEDKEIAAMWTFGRPLEPGDELLALYEKPADALRRLGS